MHQRRWLELIKDYNLNVHYHPGKANVVADALSRKSHSIVVQPLFEDGFNFLHPDVLHNIQISCTLESKIIEGQKIDKGIFHIKEKIKREPTKHFIVDDQGVLWFKDRLLSIHPRSSKMYQELRPRYWWTKMKKDIAAYVARCDMCCRVKALHMRPAGLLQPLSIPYWKWDDISMDFITSLPTTPKGNDSIWVIVDRLTKSAHFLPVKTTF
jgi:hypothetical protein